MADAGSVRTELGADVGDLVDRVDDYRQAREEREAAEAEAARDVPDVPTEPLTSAEVRQQEAAVRDFLSTVAGPIDGGR